MPALLAWISMVMVVRPSLIEAGLVLQIVSFAALFFADLRAIAAGHAPPWYRHLRRPLTAGVILCLGLTLLRVALSG